MAGAGNVERRMKDGRWNVHGHVSPVILIVRRQAHFNAVANCPNRGPAIHAASAASHRDVLNCRQNSLPCRAIAHPDRLLRNATH
jgi:hypothetical protein